jgi:trehalose/maltose hydrolase-like predicted phosphorylase
MTARFFVRARRVVCLGLILGCCELALAQDSSFVFEAASPQPYTAAYLGNGAMSLVTTPLGTEPARCFLAGVYDHSRGDVPRIASAPAWNEVDINNGSHWLNDNPVGAGIEQYRQMLDMYNGLLHTSYVWNNGGRKIHLDAEEFVSRDSADSAATRVTITPEFAGALRVRFPLRNWPAPRRYPLEKLEKLQGEAAKDQWTIWYPGQLDVRTVDVQRDSRGVLMSLDASAPGYGYRVGEAIAVQWTGAPEVSVRKSAGSAEAELRLNVKAGETYTFTKFASLVTSAGGDPNRSALAARDPGWQQLLAASEGAWHALWQSDLVVEGNPELQRTIHSMLFYLLGSMREGLEMSVPPMGLSSSGYSGHIFWDADTYMFPPMAILHPELARPMVAFRSRTREAALENAQRNGYKGAMFPWEAGPDGRECTPRFAFQNASSENHVNGDVAVAAWQYWLATGDRNWLEHDAWPLIRDTADFWASRVKFNAQRDRYEIPNVVAVKESDIGVSNDAYTNAVAKINLELAIAAAGELKQAVHPQWREIAAKMYVPESDSPLLWYSLDLPYAPQKVRAALERILPEAQRHRTGAMMGTEYYPILAAQIGDRSLTGQLLGPLVFPYLRPPFQAIAETPDNQNVNFITGAGAFLQQFVFGYTGLRLGRNGLEPKFEPVLPPGIQKLTLQNITVRNTRKTLVFTPGLGTPRQRQ